jgi:hypothetical protein
VERFKEIWITGSCMQGFWHQGDVVLVGDFLGKRWRWHRLPIDQVKENGGMSSRRGRETQWCRGESERELASMSTFTGPVGDLP